MKRIILTEEQIKLIETHNKNNNTLIGDCRNNGFDILDDRVIEKLLDDRYEEILSYFNDNVSEVPIDKIYNKLNRLVERCKRIEKPLKEQLSNLCLNTVIQTFDMPDGAFKLICNLCETIDSKQQFHIKPDTNEEEEYEDYDAITNEDAEVNKRKMINCIISGGARMMVDKSKSLYIEELFDLDEELPHLYSKIMKLNDLLLFSTSVKLTDDMHMQCGTSKITITNNEDEKNIVECTGTLFPFLLYETFKGIFELIASKCLPNDIDVAKSVINRSDILQLDPTNVRIGVPLCKRIFSDIDIKNIPDTFYHVCSIKTDKIESVFNNIGFNTRFGLRVIEDLKNKGKESYEKNRFGNDILQKQSDTTIINDGYFLSEELTKDNRDDKINTLINADINDIDFEVLDIMAGLGIKTKRTEYQLYPTINGIEIGPEDGVNFRAEEVFINGEMKYQLHIFIAPELRRMGIASKLYEAFIRQGYPVCSLYKNRVASFNRENNTESDDDCAIENMWDKLSKNGINVREIGDNEKIGIETY